MPYHCCITACLKSFNNLLGLRTISPSQNITRIVQIVGVAGEREVELENMGIDRCTMIYSNFSM